MNERFTVAQLQEILATLSPDTGVEFYGDSGSGGFYERASPRDFIVEEGGATLVIKADFK